MGSERGLRIGILCPGTTVPRWQAQAIQHLLEVPGTELVVVGIPVQRAGGPLGLVGKMEARLLKHLSTNSLTPSDLSELLAEVPHIDLAEASHGPLDQSGSNGTAPDVIISFLPLEGPVGRTHERIPVWEFRFGGTGLRSDGAPRVQGRFTRDLEVSVQVQDRGRTLITTKLSLRNERGAPSLDTMLLGAAWLPAALAAGHEKSGSETGDITSIKSTQQSEGQSSIISQFRAWIGIELRQFSGAAQDTGLDGEWNIGVLHQPIEALLEDGGSTNIRWLPAPSDGNHRLEPFGYIASDGQLNVLYRKCHRDKEFDEIARLRPKSDSVLKRSRTMLHTTSSLNFPFVVTRPDGIYALVNYAHQDRLDLFKVADTNDRLDHIKTLLDRPLHHPTSFQFEGNWWLLGTDPGAPDSVLLAFHSNQFEGPYQPHPMNPLKVDPIGTKPAGTPFMRGSDLWRPVSVSTAETGDRVAFNQVKVLTTKDFSEEIGKVIEGFKGTIYGKGIRTLCAMGDLTLIDGSRGGAIEKKPAKPSNHRRKGRKKKDRK